MTKVAVIYYSATRHVHRLAEAVEEGARSEGAETRLRHVEETAPPEAIAENEEWAEHVAEMEGRPAATLDDLRWADAYVLGTPTRFGNMASQLGAFIDTTGGLWAEGALADKVAAAFTSSQNAHGGQESTLLALHTTFHHWGALVAAPGYTSERGLAAGGNPYGASSVEAPDEAELDWARYVGERVAAIAGRLAG